MVEHNVPWLNKGVAMHLDAVVVLPLQLPQQLVVALAPVKGLKVALQGQRVLVGIVASSLLFLC